MIESQEWQRHANVVERSDPHRSFLGRRRSWSQDMFDLEATISTAGSTTRHSSSMESGARCLFVGMEFDQDEHQEQKKVPLEASKLQVLAKYLRSLSSSFRKTDLEVKKTLGINMMSVCKSAPDVFGRNRHVKPVSSFSSSSTSTNLSLDDLGEDVTCVMEEEQEVVTMPTCKPSRKRARPGTLETRIRQLGELCHVSHENLDQVVQMMCDTFGTVHFDVLHLATLVPHDHLAHFVGRLIFQGLGIDKLFQQEKDKIGIKWTLFFQYVTHKYRQENAFHNIKHAVDVMHTMYMLLASVDNLQSLIPAHVQYGVLLAAIMHDIEHLGCNNEFLLQTNHFLTEQFPDTKAPLEAMHAAIALEIVQDPSFGLLDQLTQEEKRQVLIIIKETILSTALNAQSDLLRDLRRVIETSKTKPTPNFEDLVVILRCAMHVSDISQTMKPFAIHQKWVMLLNEENYQLGDQQRSLQLKISICCDRHTKMNGFICSQVFFLEKLVAPAVKTLNQIEWFYVDMLEKGVDSNVSTWKQEAVKKKNIKQHQQQHHYTAAS